MSTTYKKLFKSQLGKLFDATLYMIPAVITFALIYIMGFPVLAGWVLGSTSMVVFVQVYGKGFK